MEEKKYELSLSDIKMFIGLGASAVCDEHGFNDEESNIVVIIASDICKKIHAHLTGDCEFTKEEIDTYNTVMCFVNFFESEEFEENAGEVLLDKFLAEKNSNN